MKKMVAFAMSLMILGSCVTAMAEEVAVNEYVFDPASIEEIEGEFMLLEDFGLQFFVPADMVSLEPSEADVAKGVIAVLAKEDQSLAMSISYAGVADAEGNLITDVLTLGDFYAASGVEAVEVAFLNDLESVIYTIAEPSPYIGAAFCMESDAVLAFNIIPDGSEEASDLAYTILGSIMVAEEVEEVTE